LEIGISILGLVVVMLFSVKLNYFNSFKSVKLLFAAAFVLSLDKPLFVQASYNILLLFTILPYYVAAGVAESATG
jgi:hypothetical protein